MRAAAVIIALTAAAYFVFRPGVEQDADKMVRALLRRDWSTVYSFASAAERTKLGWDEPRFARFCDALAQEGWPTGDTAKIDEVMPSPSVVASGKIGVDDSWNRSGTRVFAVSLYAKPDAKGTEQVFTIQFRRGMDHEWHPDVLGTLLKVDVGARFRNSSPQRNLLNALRAIGQNDLLTYPDMTQTSQQQLRAYLAGRTKIWIWHAHQPFD